MGQAAIVCALSLGHVELEGPSQGSRGQGLPAEEAFVQPVKDGFPAAFCHPLAFVQIKLPWFVEVRMK